MVIIVGARLTLARATATRRILPAIVIRIVRPLILVTLIILVVIVVIVVIIVVVIVVRVAIVRIPVVRAAPAALLVLAAAATVRGTIILLVFVIVAFVILAALAPLGVLLLVLLRLHFRNDAEVVIGELQIIFRLYALSGLGRVTSKILVFFQKLVGVAALAILVLGHTARILTAAITAASRLLISHESGFDP
jgi:hypothetical protein